MTYTTLAHEPVATTTSALVDLLNMLRVKRPAFSKEERAFCRQWLEPLGASPDAHGNYLLDIPQANGTRSAVLWSSHTDTVHTTAGRQPVSISGDLIRVGANAKSSNCLGADCTTGVWLMVQMARAAVPGLYIWHAAEEVGGLGSSAIASKSPESIEGIDYAIAFDRKGTTSIITHQGARCCSDTFADSLAMQLPGNYRTDDTGTFTDTANYTDLVGECTNISVGYFSQHCKTETQSIAHAQALLAALLVFDETELIASRKAGDEDDDRYGSWMDRAFPSCANDEHPRKGGNGRRNLFSFVVNNPAMVADLLEAYGLNTDDLYEEYPDAI